MPEKIYDIISDSDGWTCISEDRRMGPFPSQLLAIEAARAAADVDKRSGFDTVIRFQDADGAMRRLQPQP